MKLLKSIIQIIIIIFVTIGFKEISTFFKSKNSSIFMLVIYACILLYILLENTIANKKKDFMIKKAGKDGEDKVKSILKTLNKDKYKVMNSFYLRGNDLTQELDSLVISPNGIFNIEVKNFSGDITINKDGNWTRQKNGKIEPIKNPIEQIERHNKVIRDVVGKNINIIDILVVANDKATLSIKGTTKYKILLYKDLKDYICSYTNNDIYNIVELEKKMLSKKTGDSSIFKYKEKINKSVLDKVIYYSKLITVLGSIIYVLWSVRFIFY